MTKKAHLVKASVLNGHSAETNGALLFVYASPTPEVDKKAVLASFKCGKCTQEFAALAGTEPFCITCGAEDVYEDNEQVLDVEEYDDPDTELASIPCGDCGTKNIVKLTTASVLGAQVHCVTCGSSINFQAPVVADTEESEDMDMDTNDALHDSFEDTLEEGDDTFTETENIDGADAEGEPEAEGIVNEEVKEEVEAGEDDASEAGDEGDAGALDEGTPEGEPEAGDEGDAGAESSEDSGNDEDNGEDDLEEVDFEEETLAKLIGDGKLSLDRVGTVIVASVNDLPVATLAHEDAGSNANVFHGAEFASAIRHTVKQMGVEKGLSQYGFSFASVKVPVKDIVNRRVEAKVKAELAAMDARTDTLSSDFEQAFGIALAALNKGFFKGEVNPLKIGFVDMLTTANVRNPAKLVDSVFQNFGADMNKAAFELAKKLLGKSVEFRNEIASSVMDANYQVTAATDDDEDGNAPSLGHRLEGAGLKNVSKSKEVATVKPTQTIAHVEVASVLDRARSVGNGRIFPK